MLYSLKSNYEEALSRNDVKAIVVTGTFWIIIFSHKTRNTTFMSFFLITAGAKGKFSGGFDISGFGEIQKGTSMFSVSWYLC